MAIVASIFGVLGRFVGKLLNAVLGWATVLLFGKVPDSKQWILLMIGLGSIVWVVLIAGVIIPDVATMTLAFVPIPDFVDRNWVRLAMLAGALVLPLAIGGGGRDGRPQGGPSEGSRSGRRDRAAATRSRSCWPSRSSCCPVWRFFARSGACRSGGRTRTCP